MFGSSKNAQIFGNGDGNEVDEEENDLADEQELQRSHDPVPACNARDAAEDPARDRNDR